MAKHMASILPAFAGGGAAVSAAPPALGVACSVAPKRGMSAVPLFCVPYPETVQGSGVNVMGREPKK